MSTHEEARIGLVLEAVQRAGGALSVARLAAWAGLPGQESQAAARKAEQAGYLARGRGPTRWVLLPAGRAWLASWPPGSFELRGASLDS